MASVLIIDDDFIIRHTISAFLTDKGYETEIAENGKDGIEKFEQNYTDIVIVDLQMPVLDGFQVIKYFKERFPLIPLIVFSGNGIVSDAVDALRQGAWDYLMKPILDMEMMCVAIDQNLAKAELLLENQTYKANLEEKNIQLNKAYKDLQTSLKKLQEDEEAGRKIQFQLLPKSKEKIGDIEFSHKILPSQYLSGDLLNYFKIDERYTGFYIADVAGHGVSSSFITVLIESDVAKYRNYYNNHGDETVLSPLKLINELNKSLIKENMEKFSTFFYGVYDSVERKLRWSNGGQFPFPIFVDNNKARYVRKNSMPIGIFDVFEYELEENFIKNGLNIVFMSDGILEILPEMDLHDKEELLLQKIQKHKKITIESLMEEFEICNYDKLPDDITLLILNFA